jgi:hypothetical protein
MQTQFATLPYHESDHVLTFAYLPLCGGTCLQDLELLRHDALPFVQRRHAEIEQYYRTSSLDMTDATIQNLRARALIT